MLKGDDLLCLGLHLVDLSLCLPQKPLRLSVLLPHGFQLGPRLSYLLFGLLSRSGDLKAELLELGRQLIDDVRFTPSQSNCVDEREHFVVIVVRPSVLFDLLAEARFAHDVVPLIFGQLRLRLIVLEWSASAAISELNFTCLHLVASRRLLRLIDDADRCTG